ncbi:MAG: hypothetical protein EOP22_12150 [Hyphomicrobiales bacterium]|nr:MAG: hypothetical protein EOP22_12150 [Hyphomicrobiales bacterium]
MLSPSLPPNPLAAERSPWLRGPVAVPGDPAVSRLALLLAGVARGESVLSNMSSEPAIAALAGALRALGADAQWHGGRWQIAGNGIGALFEPAAPLDFSGLGEAAPLLLGLLAAHDFDSPITGLEATPVNDALLEFFARNGVRVRRDGDGLLLRGPRFTVPLDLALPEGALALKTPLLVMALAIMGTSIFHLPDGGAEVAERLMQAFGAQLAVAEDGQRVDLSGMEPLTGFDYAVPGDPLLAAYPAVAALLAPDSEVTIPGISLTPGRLGSLDALQLLGGDLTLVPHDDGATADLTVRYGPLVGTILPASLDIPAEDRSILAIAAAFAEGETMIEGLAEGQRRHALTRALRDNGIECEEREGGLLVRGQRRVPGGGKVATRLDPKLAMSFLVLGMATDKAVTIDDGGVMAGLFPDFVRAFEHVGASFSSGDAA